MYKSDSDFHAAQEIGKIYQSLTEKQALAAFFLDSGAKFTSAQAGYLFLAGARGRLWLEAKSENGGQPAVGIEEQAAAVYEEGKPRFSNDLLFIPLLVRNHILGVAVFTRQGSTPFTQQDLEMGLALGAQMAGALKNILLFEENVKMERLAAVGQTTGMVLHEIKNIMQLAKLSYEFIQRGVAKNEEKFLGRGLKNMEKALKELEGFTMDMLSLTKDYALEPQKVSLEGILKELEEDLIEKARDYKVELIVEIEPGFPEVDADGRSLYRALLNLVKNAIEASDSEKPRPHIKISVYSCPAGRYAIRIEDNGTGMSPEVKARLFEAFFSTKGKKGTGLGLLIIDRTVKNHRGEIEIESEPGKGTCFTLTLPQRIKPSI